MVIWIRGYETKGEWVLANRALTGPHTHRHLQHHLSPLNYTPADTHLKSPQVLKSADTLFQDAIDGGEWTTADDPSKGPGCRRVEWSVERKGPGVCRWEWSWVTRTRPFVHTPLPSSSPLYPRLPAHVCATLNAVKGVQQDVGLHSVRVARAGAG